MKSAGAWSRWPECLSFDFERRFFFPLPLVGRVEVGAACVCTPKDFGARSRYIAPQTRRAPTLPSPLGGGESGY